MNLEIYRGKKVFITGHTGFKGSWLALWLQMLGAEVTGYALAPDYSDSHFELLGLESTLVHHEADIRDYSGLVQAIIDAQPDFVFHLAAQALVRRAYRDPKETFDINVGGSVNLLDSLRKQDFAGVLVYITSDKCYRNMEWTWGYRENDLLGGRDPYSASKGAAELVFYSYLNSFFKQSPARIASTRAGNVIGGGDWAENRIVPDCMRSLARGEEIVLRNPRSTRPWQHVLEPLGCYLHLGSLLANEDGKGYEGSWNMGPDHSSNKTVAELVSRIIGHWGEGSFRIEKDPNAPHEDTFLQLNCDKAQQQLAWAPSWSFAEGLKHTVDWYRRYTDGECVREISSSQILAYMNSHELELCRN